MNEPALQVYVNGRWLPASEARISVFNWGFLYGDGVFEGLPVSEGKCLRLDRHIDRLFNSAHHVGIRMPMSREEWVEAIRQTARINRLANGYLRPMVTRGTGPMGMRNIQSIEGPDIVIIPQIEPHLSVDQIAAMQVRAKTVSVRRTPPECVDPRIKACNYLNLILAKLEHMAAGADTAVILDTHGFVAEGPADNIFAARRGRLYTPPPQNVLNGITRAAIMDLAADEGSPVVETNMTLYDLYSADEVFFTGSLHGIIPVTEIDGRRIGSGRMGELSLHLLNGYRELEAATAFPLL